MICDAAEMVGVNVVRVGLDQRGDTLDEHMVDLWISGRSQGFRADLIWAQGRALGPTWIGSKGELGLRVNSTNLVDEQVGAFCLHGRNRCEHEWTRKEGEQVYMWMGMTSRTWMSPDRNRRVKNARSVQWGFWLLAPKFIKRVTVWASKREIGLLETITSSLFLHYSSIFTGKVWFERQRSFAKIPLGPS